MSEVEGKVTTRRQGDKATRGRDDKPSDAAEDRPVSFAADRTGDGIPSPAAKRSAPRTPAGRRQASRPKRAPARDELRRRAETLQGLIKAVAAKADGKREVVEVNGCWREAAIMADQLAVTCRALGGE